MVQQDRKITLKEAWLAIFFAVAAGTAGVLTVYFVVNEAGQDITVGTLAGLLLGGVLTFFFAIAAIVSVFRLLGLTNEDQALALPAGSVRALIALVLILLFFLMAVFLYLNVSQTDAQFVEDLTEDQFRRIDPAKIELSIEREVPPEGDATEPRFDVLFRSTLEKSAVAEDMARQLITTIGTLIVAIAAFYFGSGAVSDTRKDMLNAIREGMKANDLGGEGAEKALTGDNPQPPPEGQQGGSG